MFSLPIARFDADNLIHKQLAAAAKRAEKIAAAVVVPETMKFQRARALVRDALTKAGAAQQIDGLVADLLGPS
jgi:hypothetical protein